MKFVVDFIIDRRCAKAEGKEISGSRPGWIDFHH